MTRQSYFAVYKQGGALCVLSIANAKDSRLVKVRPDYLSYGRALVAKHAFKRQLGDGGEDAA